jgi:phage gp45-like
MAIPSRPVPRVGGGASILHFGGERETAVIVAVADGGRRVKVRSAGGEVAEFALSSATAHFVAAGGAHGARLELIS